MKTVFSRSTLEATLRPLGYEFYDQTSDTDKEYFFVAHPDHVGITIEMALLPDGTMENIERVVHSGTEMEFFKSSPMLGEPEFYELPKTQQDHLTRILFGDVLNSHLPFANINDLVVLIDEKIKVQETA